MEVKLSRNTEDRLVNVLTEISITLREIKVLLSKIVEVLEEDKKWKMLTEVEKIVNELEKES